MGRVVKTSPRLNAKTVDKNRPCEKARFTIEWNEKTHSFEDSVEVIRCINYNRCKKHPVACKAFKLWVYNGRYNNASRNPTYGYYQRIYGGKDASTDTR